MNGIWTHKVVIGTDCKGSYKQQQPCDHDHDGTYIDWLVFNANFSSISINQSHRWMIRFNISKINGNWLLVLVELSGTIGGLFGGKEKEEEKIEETGEKPV
jgi:hypothetical protein